MERKNAAIPFLIVSFFLLLFSTFVIAAHSQEQPGRIGSEPRPGPLPTAADGVGPAGGQIFLPALMAPVGTEEACTLNTQEQQIAEMMRNHPDQRRPSLICEPILAQVARARAEDMRDRAYFSHTNPDGYGPNYLVRQAGYQLPDYYGDDPGANNIESIAGGYPTATEAWQAWMDSSGHRTHLLGEHDFYAEQIEYGIGYAAGGPFGHYWVVITAKPG